MSNSRILPEFELLKPKSIEEAVGLASQYGEKAAVLAGGTDLMIMFQKGLKAKYVLALGEIPGLDYINYSNTEGLNIGAMTSVYQLVQDAKVKKHYNALWQAASALGSPQIRNSATVLGNILRASPSGDCCCAALALGATVVLQSTSGKREVPIDDFFIDYGKINRSVDEIAVELKLPPADKNQCSAFSRITRMTFDLSKVNAAVCLEMNGKKCSAARIAVGAVAPTTIRIKKAEDMMTNTAITDKLLTEIADIIPQNVKPIDDVRSTAEYRKHVSGVVVKRVLQAACNT